MKLSALHLQHTAHFSQLSLQVNPEAAVVLFLSEQSSGKTTLLKNIYQALTWFQARYKDLRSPGVVLLDQDIQQGFYSAKLNIAVSVPEEIHQFATELSTDLNPPANLYRWELKKNLTHAENGISVVDTKQLEYLVGLYQKALQHDPQQGLPLLAYYPAERFINEVNLLSKNSPLVFQAVHAYDIAPLPFTTFVRFFEWLREVSDVENAQNTLFLQQLLQRHRPTEHGFFESLYADTTRLNPGLTALKQSLATVLPEIEDLYIEYSPRLQLKVKLQGQVLLYQQLPSSLKVWLAVVGDICRRMCLLNPNSLYPCSEGEGILMIDQIDQQLDAAHCAEILPRLQRAFPRVQIIASGVSESLLENALNYQCYRIEQQQLLEIPLNHQHMQQQYTAIYHQLFQGNRADAETLPELNLIDPLSNLVAQIQTELTPEQQQQLITLLQNDSPHSYKHPLNE